MSNPILLANDKYYAELTQAYNPGDTTLYLTTPPDNVPTLLVLARGTANETVFQVLNKTLNSVTNVTRLKGANVELLIQTPITCLNNAEFLNQYNTKINGLFTLPSGGTTGQVLKKKSNSDGDTEFGDIVALPAGGTTSQILAKKSNANGDAEWVDKPKLDFLLTQVFS